MLYERSPLQFRTASPGSCAVSVMPRVWTLPFEVQYTTLIQGETGMCMASAAIDRAKEPSNLEIGLRWLLCQSWDVCRGTASQTRCSVLCSPTITTEIQGVPYNCAVVVESNTSGPLHACSIRTFILRHVRTWTSATAPHFYFHSLFIFSSITFR